MPGIIRIKNRKQLVELIEAIEAEGGDANGLRRELPAMPPPMAQNEGRPLRVEREELTVEERLSRKVGYLFPEGIPFQRIIDYDAKFTLPELREQCRERGLSFSGDKKELASKMIAYEEAKQDEEENDGEQGESV